MVILKFLMMRVSVKSFVNKGLEYGCLSNATIAGFLEPSSLVALMYAWKNGGEILG